MSKKTVDRERDDAWRASLTETLGDACAEVRRRIALGTEPGGLATLELIGLIKTIGSINVEAGALLGDEETPAG